MAAKAGVSIKTVSRVLNREPNVRPPTRDKVLAAAEALRYRPNLSARSLAGARSFLISLFYDNPSPAYFSEVQAGAIAQCREAGRHLIVEPLDNAAPDLGRMVRDTVSILRLDGVILTPPVSDNTAVMDALDEARVPYVRIAPYGDRDRSDFVHIDDLAAAREMTEHLIGLGHRDIAFVKGHPGHGASRLRHEGFLQAMAAHRLQVGPGRVVDGQFSFGSGVAAGEQLFAEPTLPTAVFASNDDMAMGVMSVAHRRGLSLPGRLSVVGFDDTPEARMVWPQLTTVRQPSRAMAEAAAALLLRRRQAGEGPLSRLLDHQLIIRESAAAPSA